MTPDSNEKQDKDIQIEELLQLKRYECPDDAFWGQFDRELHQQMLRALVKKDPWYIQLSRGLSGQLAQSAGVCAAVVAVAVVGIRPIFFAETSLAENSVSEETQLSSVEGEVALNVSSPVEIAMGDLFYVPEGSEPRDYGADVIDSGGGESQENFERDFAMDSFAVAGFDEMAYSLDAAQAPISLGSAGMMRLVY